MGSFLLCSPADLIKERYDKFVIVCLCVVWAVYTYIPDLLTYIFRNSEFIYSSSLKYKWISSVIVMLFYGVFYRVLHFKTVFSILVYVFVAGVSFFAHAKINGFGIIDFSWYGFFYGSLAVIAFVRGFQRRAISNLIQIQENIDVFDVVTIQEFKLDWQLMMGRMVKAFFAVATILGVCMSILLSLKVSVATGVVPAWQDWGRLMHAARMAGLFIMTTVIYLVFVVAPIMELIGAYQDVLIQKTGLEPPGD